MIPKLLLPLYRHYAKWRYVQWVRYAKRHNMFIDIGTADKLYAYMRLNGIE